jgi:hypothetical protein
MSLIPTLSNQKQLQKKLLSCAMISATSLLTATPVQALKFNFTYAPNTTVEQMVGFEMAGRIWSNYLTDDVTVNIHVEMVNELSDDTVGGALTGFQAHQRYETWRHKLQQDRTSANDFLAFNNLQDEQDKFTAYVEGFKIDNNEYLNITRSNAKALGMLSKNDKDLDGFIVMNSFSGSSKSWNYNYTNNTVPTNSFDFLSVGIHEIGHVLGFVSGVDDPGWLSQRSQYNSDNVDDYYASLVGKLDHVTPLDLFRHSRASIDEGGLSEHWIDMSIGGNSFFSLDGGNTPLGYYSTGENTSLGGDGQQASHWQHQNNPAGIMAPLLNSGVRRNITALDINAFDAIGWDVRNSGSSIGQTQLNSFYSQSLSFVTANASSLRRDREQEVNQMVVDSEIYKWGSSSYLGPSGSCISTPGRPCTRTWQKAMWQKTNAAATPEASTVVSLLTFGLLTMTAYRKRGVRRGLRLGVNKYTFSQYLPKESAASIDS